MGRGPHCSEEERRLVHQLRAEEKSYKVIATMGRSQNFIINHLGRLQGKFGMLFPQELFDDD